MADATRDYAEALLATSGLSGQCCHEAAEVAGDGWLLSSSCHAMSCRIIESLASHFLDHPNGGDSPERISAPPFQPDIFLHATDGSSCSLDAALALLAALRRNCFLLLLERVAGKGELQIAATRFDAFFCHLLQVMVSSCYQRELASKHKRIREANHFILQEKRRYRSIFNRMSEPAFIVDHRKNITDVNRAFEQFVGANRKTLIGRGCCSVLGNTACKVCGLDRALKDEASFSNLEAEVTVQGSLRAVLFAGTFLGEINGRSTGGIVVIQDISDKKAIERQLQLSEVKYRSLVENVPDVTWRACAEKGLVYVSPNIERICGYTQEEIMAEGWHGWISCIYEDDRDSVSQELAGLFKKSERRDVSYRFQRKDGKWIWLRNRAGKAYKHEGKLYVDGVLSDVTKLKQVEHELEQQYLHLAEVVDLRTEELRESNEKLLAEIAERQQAEEELLDIAKRLRESNAELEQFAQIASHDMKEPLVLISAFAGRLEKKYGDRLDARGKEYLNKICIASNRLQELVQALLELARVTTRAAGFAKISLQDLLQDVVLHLEEHVRQSCAEINFTCNHFLYGDRTQIWQLFQNIISNALKYRQQGSTPVITIRSEVCENGICEITVKDNGIGFPEEDRERIFRPFFRLHAASTFEGTGMGLATCRKIVSRHGGQITAHGKPGEGSCFIVRLPLYRAGQEVDSP